MEDEGCWQYLKPEPEDATTPPPRPASYTRRASKSRHYIPEHDDAGPSSQPQGVLPKPKSPRDPEDLRKWLEQTQRKDPNFNPFAPELESVD
jgi:hypothetical protein